MLPGWHGGRVGLERDSTGRSPQRLDASHPVPTTATRFGGNPTLRFAQELATKRFGAQPRQATSQETNQTPKQEEEEEEGTKASSTDTTRTKRIQRTTLDGKGDVAKEGLLLSSVFSLSPSLSLNLSLLISLSLSLSLSVCVCVSPVVAFARVSNRKRDWAFPTRDDDLHQGVAGSQGKTDKGPSSVLVTNGTARAHQTS